MLRCNCGGAIEIVDASYSENYLNEQYECPNCGGRGRYVVNGTHDTGDNSYTSGCVVEDGDYY
jgi:phage/plasmid primase-like uncharacterized protein